jgi:uncharacterized protein YigA (DUF484 family)
MHNDDSEAARRRERVQELCRDLTQLVSLSHEQRRILDRLLAELEALAEQARQRPLVRSVGSG